MIRLQFATKTGDDTNGTEGLFHVNDATRHSAISNHWLPFSVPSRSFPSEDFF